VRKSEEKIEREGEQTRKCVWVSISMHGFCERIKVKLHFHYVTDYKIKEHYPFVRLYRSLLK
jgi:hypothetical protein